MEHSSAETIAMMAMGDPDVSVADRAHVYACDHCREQWEKLSRVVMLARSNPPMQPLQEPRSVVWERISASVHSQSSGKNPSASGEASEAAGASAKPTTHPVTADAHVARAHRRRRARRVPWGVASALAVASLAIGLTGGIVFSNLNAAPSADVVASAQLQAFPDWPAAQGEARLETNATGQRELVVTLSTPVPSNGYREVWIMSSSLKKLISVGVLTGATGRFSLPSGASLSEYSVVDISQEPDNGDPAHSGDSIVRGELS